MQASNFFLNPEKTPLSVKCLIWLTSIASLASPILTYFLDHFFHLPGPGAWLSLSLVGLAQGWIWQPLTYFFLQTAGIGISLPLLISLFFHMLLLWFTGSEIASRYTNKSFILFYLGSGVVAGLVSALFMYLSASQAALVGSEQLLWEDTEIFSIFFLANFNLPFA